MILINGDTAAAISAADRGLSYGDGVFRTMTMLAREPRNWSLHYHKLSDDCARLGIMCPPKEIFAADLAQIFAQEQGCVVKIIVTRGAGARGYGVSGKMAPTRIVISSALPAYSAEYLSAGISARLCDLRLSRQPQLAGIKHLNRLEQVIARSEWNDPAIAEGLLLDEAGWVIGGTMSNVFIIRRRQLFTPLLTGSGVAGVTRARIMALAPRLGLTVSVTHIDLTALMAADEVLLCNSVIGLWSVRELAGKCWDTGQFAPAIRALLESDDD